ncbi:MAG: holo-ACP synthase [Enterobacterales bacterium]
MTIIGIGIDIVEIKRIKNILFRFGDKFVKKILSENEYNKYYTCKQPIRFLSKKFAAKEAISKSLGVGINNNIIFPHLIINNDYLGKPFVKLFGAAKILAKTLQVNTIHITLTDERKYVCAMVILEKL